MTEIIAAIIKWLINLQTYSVAKWKIGSVFVLTVGNVLYTSEIQTHLSLLKKMEGLSRYRLPCKKVIASLH